MQLWVKISSFSSLELLGVQTANQSTAGKL